MFDHVAVVGIVVAGAVLAIFWRGNQRQTGVGMLALGVLCWIAERGAM